MREVNEYVSHLSFLEMIKSGETDFVFDSDFKNKGFANLMRGLRLYLMDIADIEINVYFLVPKEVNKKQFEKQALMYLERLSTPPKAYIDFVNIDVAYTLEEILELKQKS